LIKGVEVEVEAEEVAENIGEGKNNYEEPGPCKSDGNFLLRQKMERDPPEGRWWWGGNDVLIESNDSNK